jgi:hypothetical protein
MAQGHIPCQITHILGVVRLLAMTKPLSGVHPIPMGETLYRLTSRILLLQFCGALATHFSPHQFIIATEGECEVVIHGIKCILDLHLNWVVI